MNKFIGKSQFWKIRGLVSLRKGGRKLTYICRYENQVSYAAFPRKLRVPCSHSLPFSNLYLGVGWIKIRQATWTFQNWRRIRRTSGAGNLAAAILWLLFSFTKAPTFLAMSLSWIPINGIKLFVTSQFTLIYGGATWVSVFTGTMCQKSCTSHRMDQCVGSEDFNLGTRRGHATSGFYNLSNRENQIKNANQTEQPALALMRTAATKPCTSSTWTCESMRSPISTPNSSRPDTWASARRRVSGAKIRAITIRCGLEWDGESSL